MSFAAVAGPPSMIDLQPPAREMAALLERVPVDHLDAPTPCADYTVARLVEHIDEVARRFAALAAGTDASPPTPGAPRDGRRREVADAVITLGMAWDAPSAWEGTAPIEPQLPNAVWGRIVLTELVVHGWDLARALRLPFGLPEETLSACWEHVAAFIPNAPVPELWGPPRDVPSGAPLLDRIVAITGRDPSWSA